MQEMIPDPFIFLFGVALIFGAGVATGWQLAHRLSPRSDKTGWG
jgi:hypothetical protein